MLKEAWTNSQTGMRANPSWVGWLVSEMLAKVRANGLERSEKITTLEYYVSSAGRVPELLKQDKSKDFQKFDGTVLDWAKEIAKDNALKDRGYLLFVFAGSSVRAGTAEIEQEKTKVLNFLNKDVFGNFNKLYGDNATYPFDEKIDLNDKLTKENLKTLVL